MTIFYITISIVGVLSLVWIAVMLTFIWAENSPLLKYFNALSKTVKRLNEDLGKAQNEWAKQSDPIYEGSKEAENEIKDILRRNRWKHVGNYHFKATYPTDAEAIKSAWKGVEAANQINRGDTGLKTTKITVKNSPKKPAPKKTRKPAKKTVKPAKRTKK